MAFLWFLVFLILSPLGGMLVYWTYCLGCGPVRNRGLGRSADLEIGPADIFCLVLALPAVLAPWWLVLQQRFFTHEMLFVLAALWTPLGIGWYHGIMHLNRARIRAVSRRSLYLGLVMPATFLLATAAIFGQFFLVVVMPIWMRMGEYAPAPRTLLFVLLGGLLGHALLPLSGLLLREASLWVAQASRLHSDRPHYKIPARRLRIPP